MSDYLSNLNRLASWLHAYGVQHVVACPGSRNAPLLETLHRSGFFEMHACRDERSAAFIALGMAQRGIPAAVCCTSGTAVLNLYPAICEAYYQRVPLIAITADRPPELIDQWDGQTIHQQNIFEKHILKGVQWPDNLDYPGQSSVIDPLMQSALDTATGSCKGPVHINIPLRDPIYRDFEQHVPVEIFTINKTAKDGNATTPLLPELPGRTLMICGMHSPDESLKQAIIQIGQKIPVLCDITSGMIAFSVNHNWERSFLMASGQIPETLQPDNIISIGTSMLSKALKEWLRKFKPKQHFHIAEGGWVGDPFGTHPRHLVQNPASFLGALNLALPDENHYHKDWQDWCNTSAQRYENTRKQLPWSEWVALEHIFKLMPEGITLQLGNSMPVRYAAWLAPKNTLAVFANRGSSGIDGCVSTAVGYALAHPHEQVLLLVGDVSFFYDSNALWIDKKPENLKIILLNNSGGNIFRIIDGPQKMQVAEPYLVINDYRNAGMLSTDMDCNYKFSAGMPEVEDILEFFSEPGPSVYELMFPSESGPETLKTIKNS